MSALKNGVLLRNRKAEIQPLMKVTVSFRYHLYETPLNIIKSYQLSLSQTSAKVLA